MQLVTEKHVNPPTVQEETLEAITTHLTRIIRDTNGITLDETLELACVSDLIRPILQSMLIL